ncbi:MAG TPA: ankyrin repeat domain-containing protein [bacterium]|mgnify:CR=1 FL=1|nr:ankyrin repeat domain-containing protein [bacterium]HPS30531.1 ankyrin repeat domain-containing protein [bacterium]
MKKYMPIIKDALILMTFSSVFAVVSLYAVNLLKGGGVQTDPIIAAIIQNNIEQMKKDISQTSSRVNIVDEQGRTPLMWAAYVNFKSAEVVKKNEAKRIEATKLLLENKADPNLTDKDGWTALTWAAWSGFPQVSAILIDAGTSINAADRQGQTALMVAALRGNAEVIQMLVEKGADKTMKSNAGQSALDLAKEYSEKYTDRKADFDKVISLLQ